VERAEGAGGRSAIDAIRLIRASGEDGGRILCRALEDADRSSHPARLRRSLLRALGSLRQEEALPLILQSLEAPDPRVRAEAIRAMGSLGPLARHEASRLVELAAGEDGPLKTRIVLALARIGGDEATAALEAMAQDERAGRRLRRAAQQGLAASARSP
jgi:HEAT repeat protein